MDAKAKAPPGEAPFDLYPYVPSAIAGWTFVVIFGIGAAAHLFFIFKLRSWFFIPLFLGCIGEAFGYYGRAWSHSNIRIGRPYLMQLMLILGSAPLIAATVYMTLGRLIRGLDAAKYSIIRVSWMTKVYVIIDIASFVTQMLGSAMQGSGDAAGLRLGQSLVLGGLGIQLFALTIFILAAWLMHRRLKAGPTSVTKGSEIRWQRYFWALHFVGVLVIVRNAFRLIEFAAGHNNVLARKESFMYVFDATVMAFVVGILVIVHPGQLLRRVQTLSALGFDMGASERLV